jgi:hypothetical protein
VFDADSDNTHYKTCCFFTLYLPRVLSETLDCGRMRRCDLLQAPPEENKAELLNKCSSSLWRRDTPLSCGVGAEAVISDLTADASVTGLSLTGAVAFFLYMLSRQSMHH